MYMRRLRRISVSAMVLFTIAASNAAAQTPLGSDFTYQGALRHNGEPVNNTADFEFTLWDADVDGAAIGSVLAMDDVSVVNGVFSVELDFGVMAFNGDARWLEIAVRSPHDPSDTQAFTTLAPRQPLTATPYALRTRGIHVDDAGNVGIGTTSPSSPLTIFGNGAVNPVGITQNSVGGGSTMELTTSDAVGEQATRILMRGGSSGNAADIEFYTGPSGSETQTVHIEGANGNVGIGTVAPERVLHTKGDAILIERNVNSPAVMFRNTSNGQIDGTVGLTSTGVDDGYMFMTDQNAVQTLFVEDGKVGVGTAAPESLLHVPGPIRMGTESVGDAPDHGLGAAYQGVMTRRIVFVNTPNQWKQVAIAGDLRLESRLNSATNEVRFRMAWPATPSAEYTASGVAITSSQMEDIQAFGSMESAGTDTFLTDGGVGFLHLVFTPSTLVPAEPFNIPEPGHTTEITLMAVTTGIWTGMIHSTTNQ